MMKKLDDEDADAAKAEKKGEKGKKKKEALPEFEEVIMSD